MTRSVIFDLDGTLIDSVPDIHAAVNVVLAAEGLPPLDAATVQSFVGNGLPKLVERVMGARGVPMDQHPRLSAATLAAYNASPSALTRIYPGVEAALQVLAAQGFALGICTNKPEGPARAILADLGLMRWFASVVGGDRLAQTKPDPAMLYACQAELGAASVIYVGDSEVDADTAVAAGVPFLLFTEGYRKSPVAALPHAAAFADYAALPGLVGALS